MWLINAFRLPRVACSEAISALNMGGETPLVVDNNLNCISNWSKALVAAAAFSVMAFLDRRESILLLNAVTARLKALVARRLLLLVMFEAVTEPFFYGGCLRRAEGDWLGLVH